VTYGHTRQFVYDIVWVHGNSKDWSLRPEGPKSEVRKAERVRFLRRGCPLTS